MSSYYSLFIKDMQYLFFGIPSKLFGNNSRMKTFLDLQNLKKTLLDAIKLKNSIALDAGEKSCLAADFVPKKSVVVVCFGTPKVSGDAFGPLVADSLRETHNAPVFVYGTSENPITGSNMADKLEFIKTVHKDDFIISVDASIGENVGGVAVRKDGVCPAAVRGKKKRFGDVGVLGIVASPSDDALINLMAADFATVERLAETVADAICQAIA